MTIYAVTYRGTAEMVVWVEAGSAKDARARAETGDYEEATQLEFVKGKPYTMKVRTTDLVTQDVFDVIDELGA